MIRPQSIDAFAQSISTESIASFPFESLRSSVSCQEAWSLVRSEAADLDVVLVADLAEFHIVRREQLRDGGDAQLGSVAAPVPEQAIIEGSAPLPEALEKLREFGFCVVRSGGSNGVLTAADLQKPQGSLWAFGVVLSFESAVSCLFPSLTDGRWHRLLDSNTRKSVERRVESRRKNGSYLSDEECLNLGEKIDILARLDISHVDLPDGWRRTADWCRELRNDVAHGRGAIGDGRDVREALSMLAELRTISERLWALVDARPDVWDRYRDTRCFVETEDGLAALETARAVLPVKFWMISAQNPWDRRVSDAENARRHAALVQALRAKGFYARDGEGRARGNSDGWCERMAVAVHCDAGTICEMARLYGQRSVFEFEGDEMRVLEAHSATVKTERTLRSEGDSTEVG